jgi:hypothetical protein
MLKSFCRLLAANRPQRTALSIPQCMEDIGKKIKKETVQGTAGRGLQNRSVNSVNLVMRKKLIVFWLFCFILMYNTILTVFKNYSRIYFISFSS